MNSSDYKSDSSSLEQEYTNAIRDLESNLPSDDLPSYIPQLSSVTFSLGKMPEKSVGKTDKKSIDKKSVKLEITNWIKNYWQNRIFC